MPITATITKTVRVLGESYQIDESASTDLAIPFEVSLAAAKVGQLTTRTDANTGELTMAASHGITTGARLDLYWSGGSRRGMTVGTVATNAVPIDGGAGDDLPTNLTAVTAMVPDQEAVVFTGDNAVAVAVRNVGSNKSATFVFATSVPAEVKAYVVAAAAAASWSAAGGATNPFASASVAKLFLSHGDSTGAVTLRGVVLYN